MMNRTTLFKNKEESGDCTWTDIVESMASYETATQVSDKGKIATEAVVYEEFLRKRTLQDYLLEGNMSSQLEKRSKSEEKRLTFGVKLQPETPLPSSECKEFSDVKSGKAQLCNTRTNRWIFEDLKRIPESASPSADHISLNLELNLLPCDEGTKPERKDRLVDTFIDSSRNHQKSNMKLQLSRSPSWLALEGENDKQEMVAMVCIRCHMLVMLFKSFPACPNCKFMHSPEQSSAKLFNPSRLSLLC